jgi:hypothetical protein
MYRIIQCSGYGLCNWCWFLAVLVVNVLSIFFTVYCKVFHSRSFVRCTYTAFFALEHPVPAVVLLNSVTCFVVHRGL